MANGKVEGLVKYARSNFMTPIPEAASFEDLNAMLEERCRRRRGDVAGRQGETIGGRLIADPAAFRGLPAVALEPCEKQAARVSSTSPVRDRCDDYSVPTSFGFRDVLVKGFVDEVVILCSGEGEVRTPWVRVTDKTPATAAPMRPAPSSSIRCATLSVVR